MEEPRAANGQYVEKETGQRNPKQVETQQRPIQWRLEPSFAGEFTRQEAQTKRLSCSYAFATEKFVASGQRTAASRLHEVAPSSCELHGAIAEAIGCCRP